MAYFHTTVLDNQIKALPTVSTASGSVATFNTDLTENLVECVCQLPYLSSGYVSCTTYNNSINIWNERSEQGAINSSGNNATDAQRIRPIGYIKVTPNTQYYCVAPTNFDIYYYDATKTFITVEYTRNNREITTPGNCKYIRFRCGGSNYPLTPSTYGHDISINYPATVTTYSPFVGIASIFPTTIYGGEVEAISGTITSEYESDGTEKTTPDILQCNGGQIITSDIITNNIHNDSGDTSVKYLLTVGKKIS